MSNSLYDTLQQDSPVAETHIETLIRYLLQFPWLITGDEKQNQLIKNCANRELQERYAYILMMRVLQ